MPDTLRERIARIKRRWLVVCESIAQATPREWGALDQSYYQAGLAIIDAEVQPLVERAIREARELAAERAMEEHNAALCPEDWGCKEWIAHQADVIAANQVAFDALQSVCEQRIAAVQEQARKFAAAYERRDDEKRALQQVAHGLRDAIASVWNDAEDCEECEALEEVKGPMGGDGGPCAVHRSVTLYYALLAADEVLGPCRCGHKRSEHHDEDTTRCRICQCSAFALRETPAPAPEPQL